jgi:hypothetical protein
MAVINKANIPAPMLPKEVMSVPEISKEGDVIVRGLLLTDRVRLLQKESAGSLGLSVMLAATVVDENNEPIWTEQEWEAFGARHFDVALTIFYKAKELSGLDAEINKKKLNPSD